MNAWLHFLILRYFNYHNDTIVTMNKELCYAHLHPCILSAFVDLKRLWHETQIDSFDLDSILNRDRVFRVKIRGDHRVFVANIRYMVTLKFLGSRHPATIEFLWSILINGDPRVSRVNSWILIPSAPQVLGPYPLGFKLPSLVACASNKHLCIIEFVTNPGLVRLEVITID